jgi:CubicO group peptidase (beta-lactamase class C family)
VTVSPALKSRLAVGHDAALQPAPYVSAVPTYSLMPAAGGLVSTANDLLTFLSATMGDRRSPLAPAMAAMLATRRPKHPAEFQAIGWSVSGEGEDQVVFHDGGTFGFASALAWDPRKRVGVVLLSNQLSGVADLARHLLRPGIPLETPRATKRTEVAIDSALLDAYAGEYEAEEEGTFVVLHERGALTIRLPASWGLPPTRIRPESRRDFFATELPLRVAFEADGGGRATRMLVYPPRGQRAIVAQRKTDSER